MKFFAILASVFLLFFTLILILGVISGSESDVNESITVEAPQVVVLRILIDMDNYQQWCPNITESRYNPDTRERETTYMFGDRPVLVHEKVQMIQNENIFLFTAQNNKPRGYMQNIVNEIRLKENADGTTEINWDIRYTLEPMLSKILNLFFVKPVLSRTLRQNLTSLKALIEGM
ncbi:MAG: SRPBCC family protein [Calditrichaceae bacterium]|jgi:hypothetical protein